MIDDIVKLKDFVPFFQSCVWIIFIIISCLVFRKQCKVLFNILLERLKHGSSFKAGPIEIGEELKQLEYANQNNKSVVKSGSKGKEREIHRKQIYERNRKLFLSHVIYPSTKPNQKYDIFIYLIRHKSDNFDDIDKAEFFFGHMWGNRVFVEKLKKGIIGISTSAYAPFLCTCCIRFKDGSEIMLERYIDFEMSRLF